MTEPDVIEWASGIGYVWAALTSLMFQIFIHIPDKPRWSRICVLAAFWPIAIPLMVFLFAINWSDEE